MTNLPLKASLVAYCAARGLELDAAWAVAGIVVEDFDLPPKMTDVPLRRAFEVADMLIKDHGLASEG